MPESISIARAYTNSWAVATGLAGWSWTQKGYDWKIGRKNGGRGCIDIPSSGGRGCIDIPLWVKKKKKT